MVKNIGPREQKFGKNLSVEKIWSNSKLTLHSLLLGIDRITFLIFPISTVSYLFLKDRRIFFIKDINAN